jgi:hypothetical protein
MTVTGVGKVCGLGFALLLVAIVWRISAGTGVMHAADGAHSSQERTMSESEATGYSKKFSFDEAFQDAMKNLPSRKPSHPDEMTIITVTETGAELGGIAGLRHLKVKIKATTH